jgi:hypothetical protein
MSPKYPRTPHLPWSPGGTNDDRRLADVRHFIGKPLVITEKMDGSNVSMEREGCFARSHASAPNHPSFDAFKAAHAAVKHLIPEGSQVFGEWLYALHSIGYSALPSFFQVFGVRTNGLWSSWAEVELWAAELGTVTAPLLVGPRVFENQNDLQDAVAQLVRKPSACGGEREGVVVRVAGEFADHDFGTSVAKYVRANHVQTDDHWSHQEITRNRLNTTR